MNLRSTLYWKIFVGIFLPALIALLVVAYKISTVRTDSYGSETLWLGGVVAAVLSLTIAWVITLRIRKSVNHVKNLASSIRQGKAIANELELPHRELTHINENLQELGFEFNKRISIIEEEKSKLEAILTSMIEGVLAVDSEDRVLFWNGAASQLLNFSPPSIKKPYLSELVRFPELTAMIRQARQEHTNLVREMVVYHDQQEYYLHVDITTIQMAETHALVLVFHDITELRRLENVRKDFVANASHELKTPLTAIKGYVDTLTEQSNIDSQTQKRFITQINKNVDRLVMLTEDLLSLSRIESRDYRLDIYPVDVQTAVNEAAKKHLPTAKNANVQLDCHFDDCGGQTWKIAANTNALHEILDNLISNAIKFTPASGRVSVNLSGDASHISIVVEDTGIGMVKEEIDRIFERFYQVDKGRSRDRQGTGLGLAIVKHLVNNLAGEITVSSSINKGSCFRVSLPRAHILTQS